MSDHKDLYNPGGEDESHPALDDLDMTKIGALSAPCQHGNYVVRFYGATFTQNSRSGKVSVTQRHPALMVLNAN